MRKARWIAIVVGLAILLAAMLGWRGSRPTSPIAQVHGDGVTVVPATGTLRRKDAAPTPTPTASPVVAAAIPAAPIRLTLEGIEQLPGALAGEARDPVWSPAAEAQLRATFAAVPHLGAPPRITCRATLCAVEGGAPNGLSVAETDALFGTLQGSAMARTRADFADNMVQIVTPPGDAAPSFTIWLVRR